MSLLVLALCLSVLFGIYFFRKYRKIKFKISSTEKTLEEIAQGNLNRKLLANPSEDMATICFILNDICKKYQDRIIELEVAEQKYKELMINLSHDVRTPLASMLGYLELISTSPTIINDEEIYSSFKVVTRKSDELKKYIDLLFQWTKLDAKQENFLFEKRDLVELTREILINSLMGMLEEAGISYSFDAPNKPLLCNVDITAYERIIFNLVDNVVCHSGATTISFEICEEETKITVKITDNGIGISSKDQGRVFDKLFRCGNGRITRGNGLGLAIVKELVKKMNGYILLESEINVYTTFVISFFKDCVRIE